MALQLYVFPESYKIPDIHGTSLRGSALLAYVQRHVVIYREVPIARRRSCRWSRIAWPIKDDNPSRRGRGSRSLNRPWRQSKSRVIWDPGTISKRVIKRYDRANPRHGRFPFAALCTHVSTRSILSSLPSPRSPGRPFATLFHSEASCSAFNAGLSAKTARAVLRRCDAAI